MKYNTANHVRSVFTAQERGSAMVMALIIGAILVFLGTTFITLSLNDRVIASNELSSTQAFNLAEAGIEHAIAELPDQNVDTLLAGGGVLFNGTAVGEGTYTTTITNNLTPDFPKGTIPADSGGGADDTDGYLVVTSVGLVRNARRVVQVVVGGSAGGGGYFDYVLYGRDEVVGSGGGAVVGDVHSNGKVRNSFSIDGNASAGATVDDHSIVTGTVTEGAAPAFLPDVPCPAIPYGPAPLGADVNFDPVSGSFETGDDVWFPSGTYFFSSFSKTGGGKSVFVNAGDNVQIFVSGKFTSTGGGWINPNPEAATLQVWACGGNTQDFSFTGGDNSRLTIYAPGSKVTLTGGGDKHGAFIGRQLKMSGGANVTYDSALSGGLGGYAKVTGFWTEIW